MVPRPTRSSRNRLWTLAAVGLLAAYFLWRVRAILPPFLIAFFLAALLDPLVSRLEARGIGRGRAVTSIFLLAFLFVVLAGMLLVHAVNQLSDFAQRLPAYSSELVERAQGIADDADRWYARRRKTLEPLGMTMPPSEYLSQRSGFVTATLGGILGATKDTFTGFLGQILWLVIIPLSLFYLLLEFPRVRARLLALVPASQRGDADRVSQEIVVIFSAYVRGLTKVCLMYGAAAFLLFTLLGLNYALFLSVAAGVLYAVPYVGPAVAIAGAVGMAATSPHVTAGFVLLVLGLMVAMQVTFDYLITPRVVGGSVGLHPLVNIFALMCGAALFGVWGMVLAVPVAASAQKLLALLCPSLVGVAPAVTSHAAVPAPLLESPPRDAAVSGPPESAAPIGAPKA